MKITKTIGHDSKGKKIDLYYGTFKVKGENINETIYTKNYRTEKRAISEVQKKMSRFKGRLIID